MDYATPPDYNAYYHEPAMVPQNTAGGAQTRTRRDSDSTSTPGHLEHEGDPSHYRSNVPVSDPAPTSAFAQTERDADEQFYAVFPDAKPVSQNPWVLDHVADDRYFDNTAFYYDANGNSYPTTVKTRSPASSNVYPAPAIPDIQPPALVTLDCHDRTMLPSNVHYDYSYDRPSLTNCTTPTMPSSVVNSVPPASELYGHRGWAEQRSSGHDPGGLIDHSRRPAQFVKVEPTYATVPPPAQVTYREEVPTNMVVPSQRPFIDFKTEIRRQQQFGGPVGMHRPYHRNDHPLMGHLPSPVSDVHPPITPPSPYVHTSPTRHRFPINKVREEPMGSCGDTCFATSPPENWPSPVQSMSQCVLPPASVYPPVSDSKPPTVAKPKPLRAATPKLLLRSSTRRRNHNSTRHPKQQQQQTPSPANSHSHQHPTKRLNPISRCPSSPRVRTRLSPLPRKSLPRPAGKKPSFKLACLFCRGRKIACNPPLPGSMDKTCNQCQRRSLNCEYPLESRRGMRPKVTLRRH